jgi:hypothetical protein
MPQLSPADVACLAAMTTEDLLYDYCVKSLRYLHLAGASLLGLRHGEL